MQVRFGNLSVEQFQSRTEVKFSDEDMNWLKERRIDSANYDGDDKFHIFDMPFNIIAGFDVYDELVERLQKYDFQKSFTVEKKEKEADESTSSELLS